jgi:hypothetical protein
VRDICTSLSPDNAERGSIMAAIRAAGCANLRHANLRYADRHHAKAGNLVDPTGFEPLTF